MLYNMLGTDTGGSIMDSIACSLVLAEFNAATRSIEISYARLQITLLGHNMLLSPMRCVQALAQHYMTTYSQKSV